MEERKDSFAKAEASLLALSDPGNKLSGREAEKHLAKVLTTLLEADGYRLRSPVAGDHGYDFFVDPPKTGAAPPQQIGIEFKYRQHDIGASDVERLVRLALQSSHRTVLVANTDFTPAARAAAERMEPVKIDLVGLHELRNWIVSLRAEGDRVTSELESPVRAAIIQFHRRLASLIAQDIEALRELEWRLVEEVMAEVFEGLGFKTTLTPGSKDGGKDIILEYIVQGIGFSYYVEIKHWRSSSKVGSTIVKDFIKVVVRDKRYGGLLLATYGFYDNAFESLTEVERHSLQHGDKMKMHAFCQYYEKSRVGLWSAPTDLGTLLR